MSATAPRLPASDRLRPRAMADALHATRTALADRPAWVVGGAIRDRLLGRETNDLDVVVDGDPREAAGAIARAAGRAACFALSEEFGAWRVSARDSSWQVDVEPLRGGSLDADLALRDFTVNAIAEPLAGGDPIDPTGGFALLAAKRLRMVAASAFAEDPLRVLRLVRVAVELGLDPEPETLHQAREHAGALTRCSPERVFVELRRTIGAREVLRGLELLDQLGATAVVLPELDALRGIELERCASGGEDAIGGADGGADAAGAYSSEDGDDELATALGDRRADVAALLAEPLADGLTRG